MHNVEVIGDEKNLLERIFSFVWGCKIICLHILVSFFFSLSFIFFLVVVVFGFFGFG